MTYALHPSHPVTEVEVFAGCILGRNNSGQSKRQREYSVDMQAKHNRDIAYTVSCITLGIEDKDLDEEENEDEAKLSNPAHAVDGSVWGGGDEEALARSIACFFVGLTGSRRRPRVGGLVSFGWVAAGVCLREVDKFSKGKF